MNGVPPHNLAMPGAMSELEASSADYSDDYCPYPAPTALVPRWLLTTIVLVFAALFPTLFKWYTKQRLSFYIIENFFLLLSTFILDGERFLSKTWLFGPWIVRQKFADLQNKVPHPPQHLMSSAPSNCAGILTVIQDSEPRSGCKFSGTAGFLTSDDFAILPGQPRIFRTVDGFGNCPYSPHIGQAAQPYSFLTINTKVKLDASGAVQEKKLPSLEQVFDTLFARDRFVPNEAGLNCIILDFATLLTHDLFNSHNGYNSNSSYADLSPLYGHDPESAKRVRLFKRGLLDLKRVPYSRSAKVEEGLAKKLEQAKEQYTQSSEGNFPVPNEQPSKAESSSDGQDQGLAALEAEDVMKLVKHGKAYNWDWGFAGWRALVELFGREHNHVATKLLEWYPDRFSHKFKSEAEHFDKDKLSFLKLYEDDGLPQTNPSLKGRWINDEDLFQTARYITTRVYANIILTDYASNYLGLKKLNDLLLGRPERLGNCCSYEFGLLYHWHCLLPDDSPDAQETRGVPCRQDDRSFEKRGPLDGDYYDKLPGKACEKSFAKLLDHKADVEIPLEAAAVKKGVPNKHSKAVRKPNSKNSRDPKPTNDKEQDLSDVIDHLPETDIQLEKLLLSRYHTRIGRFGAFHTPHYMKRAEMRTLEKCRQLGVGTYNDFREHLGLPRCTTYEEINPDKKVAAALRSLYEPSGEGNENVDNVELYPGVFSERSGFKGIKFGQALQAGLLEDALNLVRNDRLLVDFDQNSATPKGYHHAVTSHLADVIERNTELRLVKQQGGSDRLVEYKGEYPPEDWRHWRLASCALMTVPNEEGTARKFIFGETGTQAAELKLFVDQRSFERGREAAKAEAETAPSSGHRGLEADHLAPNSSGSSLDKNSPGGQSPTGPLDHSFHDRRDSNGMR